MIRYALICGSEHNFEAWFSSSADYDVQAKRGLVQCPFCNSSDVEKAIMSPNVSTARKKEALAHKQTSAMKMLNEAADKIRQEIESNCDYVGNKFADEARAIHYGEKEERGIYGEATPQEAAELIDEGVKAAPLPDIIAPKSKQTMN